MLGVCKVRWLVIIAVCGMILSAFAGCGTAAPSNDDDDPLDQGENDRDDIDWDSLHTSQRGFRDGQNLKMSLWQKVDGEESSGWITVAVSESDGEFDFEYAGELGDYEFSNTCSHPDEEGLHRLLSECIQHNTQLGAGRLWQKCVDPVLENYDDISLDKVGDVGAVDNFEAEATGHKTFAGQTGINLTLKMDDKLIHEVCISPDVPINLYSYTYEVHSDNEYRVELVEYTH